MSPVSEAFYCDHCEEYKDGTPAEKLYTKNHIDRQGTDHVHRADLCEECSETFAGGPTYEDRS